MSTTITLKDLTKSFPGSAPGAGGVSTTAVDRVSLTIQAGELFFLLGPSGCGKTTLLRMIAGFIEPTSGQILFEPSGKLARDVTFDPPNKRNTGMVFQSYALWPHMTVAQNVAFGLTVRKVEAAERDRRVIEALKAVRMEQYAQRRPNQLSGGQQQRVALARALVIRPDVLLLDEPLSNLDAKLRLELRGEIRRICKQAGESGRGITTIYVTHDQKEALSIADRIAIVSQGRIVQMGPPAQLYRTPHTRFVAEFLGETNFVEGQVHQLDGEKLIVHTSMGKLVSTSIAPGVATSTGTKVLCSMRPEAFRVGQPDGTNTLVGRVRETTYLGETAHLDIEAQGGGLLRTATLNPGLISREGENITMGIATDDVVVLPV